MARAFNQVRLEGTDLIFTRCDGGEVVINLETFQQLPDPEEDDGGYPPSYLNKCFQADLLAQQLVAIGYDLSIKSAQLIEPNLVTSTWMAGNGISIELYPGIFNFVLQASFNGEMDAIRTGLDTAPEFNNAVDLFRQFLFCCMTTDVLTGEAVQCWVTTLKANPNATYRALGSFISAFTLAELRRFLFLGQGDNGQNAECNDCGENSCQAFGGTWEGVGATPDGWEEVGTINTGGWVGDTTDLAGKYQGTRTPNQFWRRVKATNGDDDRIGIKKVFNSPCFLDLVRFRANENTTNSKRLAIVIKRSDNVMEVLDNYVDAVPAFGRIIRGWNSAAPNNSTKLVKEVWFLFATGSNAGNTMSLEATTINAEI